MTKNITFNTHPQVTKLKATGHRYEVYRETKQRGTGRLGVEISSTGTKRWFYRYFINGKRQFIRLGLVSDQYTMTIAQADCDLYAQWLSEGKDPKQVLQLEKRKQEEQLRAEAVKGSIEQLFKAYTQQMKADGKRTFETVLKDLEKEAYPFIPKATKAKDVEPEDIVPILSAMIQRGAPVQSNRVRGYLMAAFNYGLKHDLDPAKEHKGVKFGLKTNPAQAVPKQTKAEKVGNNWLELSEVKALLDSFDMPDGIGATVTALLKLCFHTGGQRPYELAASKWESVNWLDKTLLITSDISKNKRESVVPLTGSAISILEALQTQACENLYIFPQKTNGQAHLRTNSLAKAITRFRRYKHKDKPEIKDFVARDIRRTCKTLMGEIGVSKELRDRIQNHALNDVSSKHYDRYDYLPEKREALRKWEAKLIDKEATVISAEFGGVKHG